MAQHTGQRTGKRHTMNIGISEQARDQLRAFVMPDNYGIAWSQERVLGLIIRFFVEADPVLQYVMLGAFPGRLSGAYADALEALAKQMRAEPPAENHERSSQSGQFKNRAAAAAARPAK